LTSHGDRLRDRFLERVLALAPASVLDVGSGAGELVTALRARGVRAHGAEPSPRHAHPHLCDADGARLPFATDAFDWVTMNHVPHHLERPAAVFAECWRVARLGLAVAEPWYDLSPSASTAGPSARTATAASSTPTCCPPTR
jgi:SAM-dependent methyltransferase